MFDHVEACEESYFLSVMSTIIVDFTDMDGHEVLTALTEREVAYMIEHVIAPVWARADDTDPELKDRRLDQCCVNATDPESPFVRVHDHVPDATYAAHFAIALLRVGFTLQTAITVAATMRSSCRALSGIVGLGEIMDPDLSPDLRPVTFDRWSRCPHC